MSALFSVRAIVTVLFSVFRFSQLIVVGLLFAFKLLPTYILPMRQIEFLCGWSILVNTNM